MVGDMQDFNDESGREGLGESCGYWLSVWVRAVLGAV